jgi:alpha-glucosidase
MSVEEMGAPCRAGLPTSRGWWRDAVVYEVYPVSFADGNADGEGDLIGLRARLPYLAGLGVDAIWITPWYPSPMADGGYDVSDYRDIHPMLGDLACADAVIADAHSLGIRVIIDMVANHTSEQHPWFIAALGAGPGSPQRKRFIFADGRGPQGELPPNNWISAFGGSAWSRVVEPDGSPGQWYLHTFAPEQPDVNWADDAVRREFDDILRFWFDRGIDGFRVDAAPAFVKSVDLRDFDYPDDRSFLPATWVDNPHWDVDEVHEIMRRWRAVGDEYPDPRYFVAEAGVNGADRLARYLRPDEMHAAFNFEFLKATWDEGLRSVIDDTLAALAPVGASATWVLESHDEVRLVTRFAREGAGGGPARRPLTAEELQEGTRQARAAALLMLALPGSVYIYQGQELGLPEVEDLPHDRLRDPAWHRSGFTAPAREGCRVPMPWSGAAPPFGFGDGFAPTWLPQPESWRDLTVQAQDAYPRSMLSLYRHALSIRRSLAELRDDALTWRESPPGVLDFERPGLRCVLNLSSVPVPLEPDRVILSSEPLVDGCLRPAGAAWLRPEQRS